eukprot:jgi/Bigna1/43726/e_gw1.83.15.1
MSSRITDPSTLKRWGGGSNSDSDATEKIEGSRFPCRPDLNAKIVLWEGDLCSLDVGAIVNSTNERLTERAGISRRIFSRAGPQLTLECRASEGCHTGDAIVTKGYRLPAPHVIHTVGPRFSVKYLTAAENALHSCYRRCLEQVVELKCKSIAFCVVNTEAKGYPKEQACHIAVRTIRRFLEKYGSKVELVVLAMDSESDLAVYSAVLPLYFPRSRGEEQNAVAELPEDVGNALGGTTIKEREVRIKSNLIDRRDDGFDDVFASGSGDKNHPAAAESSSPRTYSSLAKRQENPDVVRKDQDSKLSEKEQARLEAEAQYREYLARARKADLKDLEKYQFIYTSGEDSKGRPIVVFVASHLPAENVDMDRVLLYIIRVLDPVVSLDYVLIYVHTNIAAANKPSYSWIRKAYGIFNRKYKKNMKNLFLVHPTWWVKALFFFARPFVSSKFYRKVNYVHYLMDMYEEELFVGKKVRIPDHVIKYDQMTNIKYYNEKFSAARRG